MKNIRFDESEVMKSLSKIAEKKGWLEEPIAKTASVKKSGYVSGNLLNDIVVLCDELRSSGFEAYADEIESNYFKFSRAESEMYAHTDGTKLIDQAHPEGSVTIDVEGDPIMETILDQHLKMLNLVNKSPKGKLSSAQKMNEFKKAMGQVRQKVSLQEFEAKTTYLNSYINDIKNKLNEVLKIPNNSPNTISNVNFILKKLNEYSMKADYDNDGDYLQNLVFNANDAVPILPDFMFQENAAVKPILRDVKYMLSEFARQKKLYLFPKTGQSVEAGKAPGEKPAPSSSASNSTTPAPTIPAAAKDTTNSVNGGPKVDDKELDLLLGSIQKTISETNNALRTATSLEPAVQDKNDKDWIVEYQKYAANQINVLTIIQNNIASNKASIFVNDSSKVGMGSGNAELAKQKNWKVVKSIISKKLQNIAKHNKSVTELEDKITADDEAGQ